MLTVSGLRRTVHLGALTIHAWLALLAFDLILLGGFKSVHRRMRRRPRAGLARGDSIEDVVWAVDEACVWYFKRAACLQRSVVAAWLLRGHGVAAELVIGCRPVPFESHAWVEVDGRVVNDRPQYQKHFAVLERL